MLIAWNRFFNPKFCIGHAVWRSTDVLFWRDLCIEGVIIGSTVPKSFPMLLHSKQIEENSEFDNISVHTYSSPVFFIVTHGVRQSSSSHDVLNPYTFHTANLVLNSK